MTRHSCTWLALTAIVALAAPAPAAAQGLPHTFSPGTPARADEVNENFRYVAPKKIVYVSPVEGGSATDNGNALRAALNEAALTAIDGAPAAGNRYLIKVAPGVYDVGAEPLRMLPYVDLTGSGPTTVIRGAATTAGVVRAASQSTLSFLTVEAAGGGRVGIHAQLATTRIHHVDVRVSGSPLHGTGIHIDDRSIIELKDVSIAVSVVGASTMNAIGLYVTRASNTTPVTSVVASDVTITVTRNHASNPTSGISVNSGARFEGSDIRVTTTNDNAAATSPSFALHAWGTSTDVTLRNSTLDAKGGANATAPVFVENSGPTVKIHHSILTNHSHERFLRNAGTVRIGASQLVPGGAWEGNGTATCVYVYDAAFAQTLCINLI